MRTVSGIASRGVAGGKKQQRLRTDKKRIEIDGSNEMVDGNTHREPGRPVETGGYDGEGAHTTKVGTEVFCGRWLCAFSLDRRSKQTRKKLQWPMSGALPSTLRAWGARATRASTGCHVASGDNARPLPNPLWCLGDCIHHRPSLLHPDLPLHQASHARASPPPDHIIQCRYAFLHSSLQLHPWYPPFNAGAKAMPAPTEV